MTALIDVLVPVYNAADTLDASLDSIARQTEGDFRVIAIDDGSTDATPQVLAAWSARDPRFTVVSKPNGGIVDALNAGLAVVTAPLLARMDGDDIAFPQRFAQQRDYLAANTDCVGVGCCVQHIDGAGDVLSGFPQPGPPENADMDRLPAREPYVVHPFLMTRSTVVRAIGGYRRVPHSEDSDLFWRLSEHGRLHNLEEMLGQYRMHLGSISGKSVMNGRIMAIGSQLGALSARLRRAGRPDLAWDRDLVSELRQAGTLAAMCAHVAPGIDPAELPFFKLATAVKLLELSAYRPYEIETSDCVFIREVLEPTIWSVGEGNLREIFWYITRAGSRLGRSGRIRDAATLVPPRAYLRTVLKTALLR